MVGCFSAVAIGGNGAYVSTWYGTAAAAPGGGCGSGQWVVLQQLLQISQCKMLLEAGCLGGGCASIIIFHDMP